MRDRALWTRLTTALSARTRRLSKLRRRARKRLRDVTRPVKRRIKRRAKPLIRGSKRAVGERRKHRRELAVVEGMRDRRRKFLEREQIGLVIDVGAHTGEYGAELRRSGYAGKIVSFEPLRGPFEELTRRTAADGRWECRQLAVSDLDGEAEMNVGSSSQWSSLLPLVRRAPMHNVGTERLRTARLDSLDLNLNGERTLLKLDVQGHELSVLRGAEKVAAHARLIESELSIVKLYEGQALITEMLDYLVDRGFELVNVEPIYQDGQGTVLQVDGIFARRDRGPSQRS